MTANQAWPTLLATRFAATKGGPRVSVLNEGISGNQVLRDGPGSARSLGWIATF